MDMPEGWKKAFSRAGPNGLEASEYESWAIDWQKELLLMKEMASILKRIKEEGLITVTHSDGTEETINVLTENDLATIQKWDGWK